MPFCPQCRFEYNEGVVTCPDCNVRLVPVLPEIEPVQTADPDEPGRDWVEMARLTSNEYAEMLVEVLRAKDIAVVIHSTAGHFGQLGQLGISSFRPIGGAYSVMVAREQLVEADREAAALLGEEWEKAKVIKLDGR